MAKKPLVLGPILVPLTQTWAPKFFSWILPHLDIRNCCKLSLYTIFFKKTNEPNLRKWQKTSLGLFFFFFFFLLKKSGSVSHWVLMVSYHAQY